MTEFLETPQGRRIAYRRIEGAGPGVVFLGGFRSDMEGTKARHLADWAERTGRAFLRFDYSGHGQSSGRFEDGAVGDWAQDAISVLGALTTGPQILVGSSMGGWIALLVAKAVPQAVAGLVGIAAAPDFTEDSMWYGFTDEQRARMEREGRVDLPSGYDEGPYVITRRLIDEGRQQLVLREPLPLAVPVRLMQGTDDEDVEMSVALRLLDHLDAEDLRLTLVKGADHRFSTPACLALIEQAVEDVSRRARPLAQT
jgi:pimeloyl-ACP methyl ester carboxylesterase